VTTPSFAPHERSGQVDVLPADGEQLAAAPTRRRPQRPVSFRECGEERLGLRRRGDQFARALDRRQLDARRRVDREVAARHRPAEDHAQRHERVADGARIEPMRAQPVDEVLEVDAAELRQTGAAKLGRTRETSDVS
jgi:hypothetical protein